MATRAVALAVTRSAEIARARRAEPVLALPIAVMHEVTGRQGLLFCQIDVTTVAITRAPLIFVLMAPETNGHLGPQRFWPFHADFYVTSHAVPFGRGHVAHVLEAQVLPGQLGPTPHVHLAVTIFASALVVGLGVAANAVRRAREMHATHFACRPDPFMARETTYPFEHVGAVLEGVRRFPANTENTRARAHQDRENEQERKPLVHGNSSVRATRKRPFHSKL
jgi:hypothetical protein